MSAAARLRLASWLVAGALGALAAYASRQEMNPDGVAYLDLADAWRRGDLAQAVSLYWSPLYSWLLAAALALVGPSARGEFPLAHLLNFLLYLGALASLEYFLRCSAPRPAAGTGAGWPAAARAAWAHALFLVGALGLVTIRLVTPDLIVLGVVLLAAGLLCRLADGAGPGAAVALGAVLGLGALAKAAMLPVAVVTLALAAVAAGSARRAWPRAALALAALALVVAPWIAAMSSVAGRPTLGDNARLNYLWLVSREYRAPFFSSPGARPPGRSSTRPGACSTRPRRSSWRRPSAARSRSGTTPSTGTAAPPCGSTPRPSSALSRRASAPPRAWASGSCRSPSASWSSSRCSAGGATAPGSGARACCSPSPRRPSRATC